MKTLQYIKIVVCLWGLCVSCDTQQNVINSGVSSPYHDCTILDYLRGDEYNWELTVAMIERAGLQDLFEGRVDSLPEITFFAPPSYCILRYLWIIIWNSGRVDTGILPENHARPRGKGKIFA